MRATKMTLETNKQKAGDLENKAERNGLPGARTTSPECVAGDPAETRSEIGVTCRTDGGEAPPVHENTQRGKSHGGRAWN